MLVIFAVIIGGIIAGRLLSSWRLVFVSRMITVIIWLLLFLLGLEVGSDPAVVGGMATLGRTAFVIFACSVAGSICMSWLLWRCVRHRDAVPDGGGAESPGLPAAAADFPRGRQAARPQLAGTPDPFPYGAPCGEPRDRRLFRRRVSGGVVLRLAVRRGGVAPQHLCALCPDVLRGDHPRQRYGPCGACAAARSAAGAAARDDGRRYAGRRCLVDTAPAAAYGRGHDGRRRWVRLLLAFEYLHRRFPGCGAGDGGIALQCHARAVHTVGRTLVARWFGPLAAVSIGGATTFDTTLPIITQSAGKPYAVVSVFHGCVLDFSVPFLVTFFCTM